MPKTRSTPKQKRNQNPVMERTSASTLTIMNRMLQRTVIRINEKFKSLEEKIINGQNNAISNHETAPDIALIDNISSVQGSATSTIGNASDTVPVVAREEENTNMVGVSKELMQLIKATQHNGSEKPKYPGKNQIHPVTFIEDLTTYLKRFSYGSDLDVIFECLEGECRNWARIYKEQWNNVEDFKRDFLNTYWGEAEQSNLRKKIVQYKWSKGQSTMLQHFISLVGQAKMLSYTIPEKQLVNDIMSHFPKNIQYAWATNQNQTVMEAAEFLRKLDSINQQDSMMEVSPSEPRASTSQQDSGYQTSSRPKPQRQSWKNTSQYQRPKPTTVAAMVNEDDGVVNMDTNTNDLN